MSQLMKKFITCATVIVIMLAGGIAQAQDFKLTADVFRNACASPSAQCNGFAMEPALEGNDQPVFLTVQVLQKQNTPVGEVWVPVTGLNNSLFDVDAPYVGPGGSQIQKMTCKDCFQSGNGVYRIWIEPINGDIWVAGLYTIEVSIDLNGQKILPAITQLEIPANKTSSLLSAPNLASPADGTTFDKFPRTTTVDWDSVSGADSYILEIDCFHCCKTGEWCTDVGETWRMETGINNTQFTFDFVGAQPGRWRVWAVDSSGRPGVKSEWREFEHLQ